MKIQKENLSLYMVHRKKKWKIIYLKIEKKFNFKISVARIFNFTHQLQKKGHFVPDMINKIKKGKKLKTLIVIEILYI